MSVSINEDKLYIAPSILAADFLKLGEEIEEVAKNGAQIIHFDVMDGLFVPNLSFGIPVIQSASRIKERFPLIFDVHLMIEKPERYIKEFSDAGADIITFHFEATSHHMRVIDMIKKEEKLAGIAINPGTSPSSISYLLPFVDIVLVMTVNPGFSGQSFIPQMIQKIKELDSIRKKEKMKFLIEVDGGLNNENIGEVVKAGANIAVFGAFVFTGNRREKIEAIKKHVY